MIKINLLGTDGTIDSSKPLQLVAYCSCLVLTVGILFYIQNSVSSAIFDLTQDKERLQLQLDNLKKTTQEVRNLERKKDDLRLKLSVIAKLKKSKTGPVRVLDDLNASLPEKSWLLEVKESGGVMRIVGLALDNQTIAGFMQELDESDYFEKVDLVEARQSDWKSVKMKRFTLQAGVNYVGKLLSASQVEGEAEGEKSAKKGI